MAFRFAGPILEADGRRNLQELRVLHALIEAGAPETCPSSSSQPTDRDIPLEETREHVG